MTPEELQETTNFLQRLSNPRVAFLFTVLVIWALAWKGVALWRAAKNNNKAWYIAMLVINTLGILEITYIFFFSKKKQN